MHIVYLSFIHISEHPFSRYLAVLFLIVTLRCGEKKNENAFILYFYWKSLLRISIPENDVFRQDHWSKKLLVHEFIFV